MGIIIHFCSDVGTTWYLVWPLIWNDSVYCFLSTMWFISSRAWKILVRPCPYRPYRFWWPCFSANKYMHLSLTFKRHMTLYGTMVCFINLVLKSMALFRKPDSEHAMCSRNKSHCMKYFICTERITSRIRMPPSPNLFNLYVICFQYLIIIGWTLEHLNFLRTMNREVCWWSHRAVSAIP